MLVSVALGSIQIVLIVIFLGWRTFHAMNKVSEQMLPRTRCLHNQINLFLLVQITIIFFITTLPQILYSVLVFFRMAGPGFGTLEGSLLSFNQCVNPLCTLILVKHYRMRLLRTFRVKQKESSSNMAQKTSSIQYSHPTNELRTRRSV
jgi:hypothetical protein